MHNNIPGANYSTEQRLFYPAYLALFAYLSRKRVFRLILFDICNVGCNPFVRNSHYIHNGSCAQMQQPVFPGHQDQIKLCELVISCA